MPEMLPPQPVIDADSRGFWEALERGCLAVQRCTDCGRFQHPPAERCRRCGSVVAYEDTAGTGTVFSFIVVRHPTVPGYLDDLPYIVALVQLDEQLGLRLPARVVGPHSEAVQVGDRVRLKVVDLPGGAHRLPVFELGG